MRRKEVRLPRTAGGIERRTSERITASVSLSVSGLVVAAATACGGSSLTKAVSILIGSGNLERYIVQRFGRAMLRERETREFGPCSAVSECLTRSGILDLKLVDMFFGFFGFSGYFSGILSLGSDLGSILACQCECVTMLNDFPSAARSRKSELMRIKRYYRNYHILINIKI